MVLQSFCKSKISELSVYESFPLDCKGVTAVPIKVFNDVKESEIHNLMHGQPAYWIMGLSFVFFSLGSWFMDEFIVSSQSCLSVFVIGSYVIFCSYYMIHYYLKRLSASFRNLPEEKQFYVLSNLIKFAALLSYSPIAFKCLVNAVWLNQWDTRRIRNMGCMYAITDFVSMLMVTRMNLSTKFHHICVVIFATYSCFNDYEKENVARMMVVYAIFSVFAYLVNLLLASRFFELNKTVSQFLSVTALSVYAMCCSINWSWQIYYGYRLFLLLEDRTYLGIYIILIAFIVLDDVKLMSWLAYNVRKKYVSDPITKMKDQNATCNPLKKSD